MAAVGQGEVTHLLRAASVRGSVARDQLFELVYPNLRALAAAYFRTQPQGHTLQPTAVVNEAYLKLVNQEAADWQDRNHFFAVCSRAMRQILVDYARAKNAHKRDHGGCKLTLDEAVAFSRDRDADVLAVDAALEDLAKLSERQAEIVELRFFGGLTVEETAHVLGVSERTIHREWRMCRAWLRKSVRAEGQ